MLVNCCLMRLLLSVSQPKSSIIEMTLPVLWKRLKVNQVALRWPISILCRCFVFRCGFQANEQYTRSDLTIVTLLKKSVIGIVAKLVEQGRF